MSNLDDGAIEAAYAAVRSDTDETNWCLLSYAEEKRGDKLVLSATGSGGLAELKAAFDDAQAQYGYLRLEYANDKESTRVKHVLVVWIGASTPVMRKARVGFESSAVKDKMVSHITIEVGDREADLKEEDVVSRCRKAGGADYNGGRG